MFKRIISSLMELDLRGCRLHLQQHSGSRAAFPLGRVSPRVVRALRTGHRRLHVDAVWDRSLINLVAIFIVPTELAGTCANTLLVWYPYQLLS